MDAQFVSGICGQEGVAAYLERSPEYRNEMSGLVVSDADADERIFEYGQSLVRVEFLRCVVSPFRLDILKLLPMLCDLVFTSCDVRGDDWHADTYVSEIPCVHLHFVCCTGSFRNCAPVSSFKNIVALTIDRCNEIEELFISNQSDLATITIVGCDKLYAVHFVPSKTATDNDQMHYVKIASNPKLRLITGLHHCPNIHNLELPDNATMPVLPDLNVLPNLDLLGIDGCLNLAEFPRIDATRVQALRRLHVNTTNSVIRAAIDELISEHNIEMLWYGSSGRYRVPDAIVKSKSLKNLGLTGQLVNLADVCEMSQLTELRLDLGYIAAIPDCISKLNPTLVTLHLSNCCNLEKIGGWLGELTQLCSLVITGCTKLQWISPLIGGLQNLALLRVSGCPLLSELPQTIMDLSGLVTLCVTECTGLTAIPNPVETMLYADRRSMQPQRSLPLLSTLVLDNCTNLVTLPASLGTLTGITTLSVAGCTLLAEFPLGIGKLINLQDLDICRCPNLTTLPVTTVYLENLEGFKYTSNNPDIVMSALDIRVNAYGDMLKGLNVCWDGTNDDAFPDNAIVSFFSQMSGRDSDSTSTISSPCMLDWIPRNLVLEYLRRNPDANHTRA